MPRDRSLKLALAIVALSVVITPWRRELFVGDETKYSQVVREMRAGSFLFPTLEGTPFTHKPPMHFWAIDVLTYPFGVYSVWPFVIPSLVGFIALLWLMAKMEGLVAAFVCGTSLMMWGSAQTARMDITFTLAIAIAAWMILRSFEAEQHLVAAGVWLGVATLIKGPMAPVIGIALVAIEWLRRRARPRGSPALAIAAMVIIPLLWFVPAMLSGGESYTREVLVKQTAGRAVGAWTHRSPFWFYIAHAPATLFPWFLLLVVAVAAAYKRQDDRAKFYVSWILAVLVPYSLLSSKLDVYMMAMIPPVALLIARLLVRDETPATVVNGAMLVVLLVIGVVAPFVPVNPDLQPAVVAVKPMLFTLAGAALAGIIATAATRSALVSTLAVGLTLVAALMYAAIFLMPLANEMASDRPVIRALVAQRVAADQIALYWVPHLWTRNMPRELERVHYVSPETLRTMSPEVIVTSRRQSRDIAGTLARYRKVDEFQMIGKWFDVYRR